FNPMGGVMTAISQAITSTTPNQIGSKPRVVTTGNKMGVVIRMMETMSRNMPMISRNAMIIRKINHLDCSRVDTHMISFCGIIRRVVMYPNSRAEIMMSRIMPVVTMVDRTMSKSMGTVSSR